MNIKKPDYQQYRRYYQVVSEVGKRPNTRLYTTVAFTFLTISLFAWYAIRPTLQTILYLRREIADNTLVNQKMEEKIGALIEAQSLLAQIEPSLPLLDQALPAEASVVSLLGQLNSLATISEASLSSARGGDVPIGQDSASKSAQQKAPGPMEVPLSITLTGTYEKLKSFLDAMMDMRRIIAVDSISISADTSGNNTGVTAALQLVLRVRSFYMSQK